MNPFVTLGLPYTGVTKEKVKAAYRQLARQFHPDRAGLAGLERMQDITTAYQTIMEQKLYVDDAFRLQAGGEATSTQQRHPYSSTPSFHKSPTEVSEYNLYPNACRFCQRDSNCSCLHEIELYRQPKYRTRFWEVFVRLQIYVMRYQNFSPNVSGQFCWDETKIETGLSALEGLWKQNAPYDWRERFCFLIARILYDCFLWRTAVTPMDHGVELSQWTVQNWLHDGGVYGMFEVYELEMISEAWQFLRESS